MITIIVPCKNRLDKLEMCVKSIYESIEYAKSNTIEKDYELIVVNDHSDEGFVEKTKETFPNLIILNSDGFGPGYARNYGIKNSNGKYIFFTDSDCIVSKEWIFEGYNEFISSNEIVIQGIPWLFQKNTNIYMGEQEEKLYKIMFSTYIEGKHTKMTDSRNLLIDRKIVDIIGDEVFSEKSKNATAESRVFGNRCNSFGINVLFGENIKIYHEDSSDMNDVCKQKYRHGSGRIEIWKEKPEFSKLKFRYFENPINNGMDINYILPAHFAFLLGYYENLKDESEFNKFIDFSKTIFNSYGKNINNYDELKNFINI